MIRKYLKVSYPNCGAADRADHTYVFANSQEKSRQCLVTDRDLVLGRDCLFSGISVLGRDNTNLGRDPIFERESQ